MYRVIVIDPPWPGASYPSKLRGKVISQPVGYQTMTMAGIYELSIPSLLAQDGLVFLWVINRFLRQGFELLEHWGLHFKHTIIWHKRHGPKPVGYPIYNHEQVLVANRGGAPSYNREVFRTCNFWEHVDRSQLRLGRAWGRQVLNGEKPEAFYELLRGVTDGPRLDMFNRRRIDGFDTWGHEAETL